MPVQGGAQEKRDKARQQRQAGPAPGQSFDPAVLPEDRLEENEEQQQAAQPHPPGAQALARFADEQPVVHLREIWSSNCERCKWVRPGSSLGLVRKSSPLDSFFRNS